MEPPADDFVAKMMAEALKDDDLGATTNMDSPGVSKSSPKERRFGGAQVKRYRRRSTDSVVGTKEKQQYLHMVLTTWRDIADGKDSIHFNEVAQVVKDHYQPSIPEIQRVTMWLDTSQDGLVSFDEYCTGMAGVMRAAGLTAMDGLDGATEALADDLANVMNPDSVVMEGNRPESPRKESLSELIEEVRSLLGEEVVGWLRTNFDQADSTKSGELSREELIELIKLTYVPRGAHLEKMMKWFEISDRETMLVTKEAFMNGFYQLAEDLSFVLSPEQSLYAPSPRSCSPQPSPDRLGNVSADYL